MDHPNVQIVRRFYDQVENRKDASAASKLWVDDLKWHGCKNSPFFPDYFEGIENLEKALQVYFRAVDPRAEVVQTVRVGDDRVAARLHVTARHTGELLGCEPTGRDAEFTAAAMFIIRDGKIVEEWIHADFLGMALQFGFELRLPNGSPLEPIRKSG
ncbi:ester cyclase [Candidatus Foliamicus sp.]